MTKTYHQILADLRSFETTQFRNDVELKEGLAVSTYDALVALLTKLSASEPASKPPFEDQGPEMTQEQVEAMDRFKSVWQPIADVLRGDAP